MGDYVWPAELGLTDAEKYQQKWGDQSSPGSSSSESETSLETTPESGSGGSPRRARSTGSPSK